MSAHLLVMYPHPTDVPGFERAYREEHLPYVATRLAGATGVTTKRAFGPNSASYHLIWDVAFPSAVDLLACTLSTNGQQALAHALSISTGGTPQVIAVVDDSTNLKGQL